MRAAHRDRLRITGLLDFAQFVRPRPHIGETVTAIGCGRSGAIDRAITIQIQLDGPASQPRLAGILHAVAVAVVKLLAAKRHVAEVAKVDTYHVLTAD